MGIREGDADADIWGVKGREMADLAKVSEQTAGLGDFANRSYQADELGALGRLGWLQTVSGVGCTQGLR